jgi:hypothetical protein
LWTNGFIICPQFTDKVVSRKAFPRKNYLFIWVLCGITFNGAIKSFMIEFNSKHFACNSNQTTN